MIIYNYKFFDYIQMKNAQFKTNFNIPFFFCSVYFNNKYWSNSKMTSISYNYNTEYTKNENTLSHGTM